MGCQIGKADEQLLLRGKRARIVGNDHRLSHTFDAQGLAEFAIRVKLASVLTCSHSESIKTVLNLRGILHLRVPLCLHTHYG